ncbi:MAG: sensor histidine kinase [Candidatus Onthomonas sp.]
MSVFWNQIFDYDGLVECIAMVGTMMAIFPWKFRRGKMLLAAAFSVTGFFVSNSFVIAANEIWGLMPMNVRFGLYMVLAVCAGFFFSVLCLKGCWQQFLVTILFFKDCVLFVSFLYKRSIDRWAALFGNELWAQAAIYLLGLVMILLSAILCKKMTKPIRTKISPGYWCISILTPIFLILLYESIMNTTMSSSLYFNALMLAVSFSVYALFIRLAQEMEHQLDLQLTNQSLAFQVRQMDNAQVMLEQTRIARHELKNNYFYLEALLKQGKYEQMQAFLDQVIWPEFQRQEQVSTGNQLVDMILSQKVMEARQKGIPIVLDVLVPKNLKVQPQMLCSLLFNLLDNAIEASQQTEHPDIYCAMQEKKGYLSIEVRNKIDRSVLQENPKLHTSKPDRDNHGIGMKMIRQVVERCDGSLDIREENGWFIVHSFLPERDN